MTKRPQGQGASAPTSTSPTPIKLPINGLTIDPEIQQRALMSDDLIAEYAAGIANWIKSAPIDVFDDGQAKWVADGFHRVEAALTAGLDTIWARQHLGTRRDALLFAVGANQRHGLRRTNADKRRAVETLLKDSEWARWSDRMIADRTGVSHPTVASIRRELEKFTGCDDPTSTVGAVRAQLSNSDSSTQEPTKRLGADGKERVLPTRKPDPEPVIVEEIEGDDFSEIRTATSKLHAETAAPAPATPAPKPPTAKDAMHAAHRVTGLLGLVRKALEEAEALEGAMLESDARVLIRELRTATDRLVERFGEPEEVSHG